MYLRITKEIKTKQKLLTMYKEMLVNATKSDKKIIQGKIDILKNDLLYYLNN